MSKTIALLIGFMSTAVGFAEEWKEPLPVYPVPVVAHRGSSFAAPENTLASAKLSIAMNADGSECDVYQIADGTLVLLHDANLKRTTGLDKKVVECDYDTVSKLDAGSWKDPKYAGEKIPTLPEYLSLFKGANTRPVIEIKMEGIELPVVQAIQQADLTARVVVIAFSENVVKKVREIEPRISVAWLYGKKEEGWTVEQTADFLTEKAEYCNTRILDLNHELLSPELLKILRNRGFFVWAWTVDDPARMETLLRWGIDSITTNKPDLLIEIMNRK